MSAGRRASPLALLFACAVLATTASAARAQVGSDRTPPSEMSAVAPLSVTGPAQQSSLASPGSTVPFQLGMGMVAFRWLEPVTMGRFGSWTRMTTPAHAVAEQPAWWWRRL